MEINFKNNCRIITPLSPKLTNRETKRIEEVISRSFEKRTAIDMSLVQDCTIDFIESLKQYQNISLFNINSDIFAVLISMGLDKSMKLFVSEIDFINNKRQLLNRNFNII